MTRSWQDILFNRRMLICIFLGLSSGMPLYVLIQLVPAWLRTEGVDLSTIGLLSLATFPYTWKWVWSPLMDRYRLPLGRRRGWALLMQLGLFVSISLMGFSDPNQGMGLVVTLVVMTAMFSASQDVVIDAYRRELLPDDELGTGNSIFVNAYRLSSLVPGSLGLIIADLLPWTAVFPIVAAFMFIGVCTTLMIREISDDALRPKSLRESVILPFIDFFSRDGWKHGVLILIFMVLYKLGDNMATALSSAFYLDLGFSLTQIGSIAKFAALWSSIAGSVLGGIVMLKVSINRALWLFGAVQILSILGFALLAHVGDNPHLLFWVVSFEYLGVGLGTVALVAFMARQASLGFAATQLALLTALTSLPRVFANASTGYLIEWVGYFDFFLLCTAVAVPGMLLLFKVAPWNETAVESSIATDQAE